MDPPPPFSIGSRLILTWPFVTLSPLRQRFVVIRKATYYICYPRLAPCSLNVGEALVAQLACSLATTYSISHFIIEGDSKVVIHALQNPNSIRDWRISSIILDTLDSISIASLWEARKIQRSVNFCAHSIARWIAAGAYSGSIPTSSTLFLFSSPHSGGDSHDVCLL